MPLALPDGMVYMVLRSLRCWRSVALVLLFASRVEAGSLTLAWDPSSEPDVVGYTLAYGTQSAKYTNWLDVGNTTSRTISSLPDGTYYFAVRAYTSTGLTSGFSNEIVAVLGTSITTSAPGTSSCTTPDPFASMGGGTCYNGGWLAPGMVIPGSSPSPAPAPAPAPASPTSCVTADPFAAMGGGTCYNGGWLPPGMAVPGGTTSPAPPATSTPPPTSVSAPPSGGACTTPDPFAAMGGGTCYNGGWLPPGMAIPGGGTSSPPPASTPPPPSSPPASTGGCVTPDPFAAMGGGTCYNGGWLPPGMTIGGEQGVDITVTGMLHVVSGEEGLWLIEGEDGTLYTSTTELPAEALVDGAIVTFTGRTVPGAAVDDVIAVEIFTIELQ